MENGGEAINGPGPQKSANTETGMNAVKLCRHGPMIYNTADAWVGRSFAVYGELCEAAVRVFRACLAPGAVALDVGANTGGLTGPLARLGGPAGRVLAFEPERTNYYTLCGNVALNTLTHVRCHQMAVGNATGTVRVPELDPATTANWGGLSLEGDFSRVPHYAVPINTIDRLGLDRLDLIKIDVGGM